MLNDINYVYGDQDVQVPAHLNFGKFMLNNLRKFKDKTALINTTTKEALTYGDIITKVANTSIQLRQLGVEIGDCIGVGTEPQNEFIPLSIAIISTGAIFMPIDIQCGKVGLLHKLSITKPKYFICSASFWNWYGTALQTQNFIKTFICLDETPDITISLKEARSEKVDVDYFEPVEVRGQEQVAMVFFSSGTTGMPKGIMLTHLNCILDSFPEETICSDVSTILVYGEWHHTYDLSMTYSFLNAGKTIIYSGVFTVERIIEDIHEYKVNICALVPYSILYLTKMNAKESYKLASLKCIYSAASKLHVNTIMLLKSQYPTLQMVVQGYGMTETGDIASEEWGTKGMKPGSVGMAAPGTTVKVVDLNTRKTLGSNKTGEICVKGPVLMKGYIDVDPKSYLDEQGFLKTGDLGYYDEDGYFFITDRIKELLELYNGAKLAPVELEAVLLKHPGVKEAAIVGKRDPVLGDLPTAFVIKQPDYDVTEKELIDFVAAQVSKYEQLTGGLRFITEIPKNFRGKILRKNLRELLN